MRAFCLHAAIGMFLSVCHPVPLAADVFHMPDGQVSLTFVTVGQPNNPPDTRYSTAGFGAVAYPYQMAVYEVTAGQYAEFLNAVARSDPHGLWTPRMDYELLPSYMGCNIRRSESAGQYTYSVATDWANRPVNFVSWADAGRFCNWLHNGQPTGEQGPATTEDGAYVMGTAVTDAELCAILRKSNASFFLPTYDEWYKAAYFDPGKPGGPGYWDYPTRSDVPPANVPSALGVNNANVYISDFTFGPPFFRTEVGFFGGSPGPYGTFDQGGNVAEWDESVAPTWYARGCNGGSFWWELYTLKASYRSANTPVEGSSTRGFRVLKPLVPFDFNGDEAVDAADCDLFLACTSGPAQTFRWNCEDKDLDIDGDVDQEDFGRLQLKLGSVDAP